MSEYKRLTYRANGITYSRALTQEQLLHRLAELEDKIKIGELGDISSERHRSEAADITIKELREKLSKAEHDRDRYKRRMEVGIQAMKDMIETDGCFGCHARYIEICDSENVDISSEECIRNILKQAEKELHEGKK